MKRDPLIEVFRQSLNEGWVVIASNVYTAEYFLGVARAMYETKSPGIIQASSDTLPCLSNIYSQIVRGPRPSVNDLLRGASRISHQRRVMEEELDQKGDRRNLAVYLAVDHSDPLNKIFLSDETHLVEYRELISGTPQEDMFGYLEEKMRKFWQEDKEGFRRAFSLQKENVVLDLKETLNLLAKYLLFTEKLIMGGVGHGINVDMDYVALDFSFPAEINTALTKVVTATRDFHARDGRYILVESGFGIESEKKVLNEQEQKDYAEKIVDYVTQTNIDAVSCNIGTYHGEMVRGQKDVGSLHTTLMAHLRSGLKNKGKELAIIVGHGGSSISDECLQEIGRLGLVKINKASVYISRYASDIRDYLNSPEVFRDGKFNRSAGKGFNLSSVGIEGVKSEAMRLFQFAGSAGKAPAFYR